MVCFWIQSKGNPLSIEVIMLMYLLWRMEILFQYIEVPESKKVTKRITSLVEHLSWYISALFYLGKGLNHGWRCSLWLLSSVKTHIHISLFSKHYQYDQKETLNPSTICLQKFPSENFRKKLSRCYKLLHYSVCRGCAHMSFKMGLPFTSAQSA
jgi:hypothetical protein